MKWSRLLQRWRHESDAGPIVEFAIVAPVIVIMIYGFVDLARAITQQSNLISAAREGARFGAVQLTPCSSTSAIKAVVTSRFTSMTGATLADSLITVTPNSSSCPSPPYDVVVTIRNFPFRSFVLLNKTIPLASKAVFRWERGS